MANEKRLIFLDEAIAKVKDDGILGAGYSDYERIEDVCDILESCEIVDAVQVVRCKDCLWAEYGKDYEPYCNHWKSGLYANIKDDDFCSYGERKDNG